MTACPELFIAIEGSIDLLVVGLTLLSNVSGVKGRCSANKHVLAKMQSRAKNLVMDFINLPYLAKKSKLTNW